jgi:hypothetical protein
MVAQKDEMSFQFRKTKQLRTDDVVKEPKLVSNIENVNK